MAKKRKIKTRDVPVKEDTKRRKPEIEKSALAKQKVFIAAGSILIMAALILWVTSGPPQADEWMVDDQGFLTYPADRGVPVFDSVLINFTPQGSVELINYSSRDARISALLRIPNHSGQVPGVLVLPGATVSKEKELLAAELADMGYASMVIDQRNLGGVDFQRDTELFEMGQEPVEHKMVYDALRAVDVMRQYPEIDPDNIAIIGISNGGRFAIIATAIDPSIRGVVGISTSGYDVDTLIRDKAGQITLNQTRFLRSIDPDTYLDMLPPRKLVMIHMVNDSIIDIQMARATYGKASDPRAFYPVEGSGHGYNLAMRPVLEAELGQIFS